MFRPNQKTHPATAMDSSFISIDKISEELAVIQIRRFAMTLQIVDQYLEEKQPRWLKTGVGIRIDGKARDKLYRIGKCNGR